jgi:ATP-binding cassette subfamily F protein 3
VLNAINWEIGDRERIGLVGPNGAGKTTLLRVLTGELQPDSGTMRASEGQTAGYLAQESQCALGHTVYDEMLTAFPRLFELRAAIADLEPRLSSGSDDVLDRYAAAQAEFRTLGGASVDARIATVLHGLGFAQGDRDRMTDDFSGGWQMRIALAKILVAEPSLLLLDEPTNHIDLAAREWLETYLSRYNGTVVITSHDSAFLDAVVTRIAALEDGVLTPYVGNYSAYLKLKERQARAAEAAYKRQQAQLSKDQKFIEKFRSNASRAAQAKSREKQLGKVDKLAPPRKNVKAPRFRFPEGPRAGDVVLETEGLTKRYAGRTVLQGIDLRVERGERVALVGPNGAGKSTLLRLLAGVEAADGGTLTLGYRVRPAYYAQHQAEALDRSRTVLEEVLATTVPPLPGQDDEPDVTVDDTGERVGVPEGMARSLLGRMLFSGDAVFKPISALSGGERSRVAFVKLLVQGANLLLLDEPTNHLDAVTQSVLIDALREYPGTVIAVSHDRRFLAAVATRLLYMADGRLQQEGHAESEDEDEPESEEPRVAVAF